MSGAGGDDRTDSYDGPDGHDRPDGRGTTDGYGTSDEAREVRRFWEGLGLPGLVDVHTHFMPERVLKEVWEYFDALGSLTGGVEWPITYRAEERERVGLLPGVRGAGVHRHALPAQAGHGRVAEPVGCRVRRTHRPTVRSTTATLFPGAGRRRAYVQKRALDEGARGLQGARPGRGRTTRPTPSWTRRGRSLAARRGARRPPLRLGAQARAPTPGPRPVGRQSSRRHPAADGWSFAHLGMQRVQTTFAGLAERLRRACAWTRRWRPPTSATGSPPCLRPALARLRRPR